MTVIHYYHDLLENSKFLSFGQFKPSWLLYFRVCLTFNMFEVFKCLTKQFPFPQHCYSFSDLFWLFLQIFLSILSLEFDLSNYIRISNEIFVNTLSNL